ncbi:hypothetical protein, partial [Rhodopirellula sallentina]|uniref:hypothetical protein n=1 Tax=Rhodopirellula sallentina TaxID=1263869 RepID=UPI0005C7D9D0
RSHEAELVLIKKGARIGNRYHQWMTRPYFPILDAKGKVSPSSCNPHVNLLDLTLDPTSFRDLASSIHDLIPTGDYSHVAIYLRSSTPGRKLIEDYAKSKLQHCVIFDESQISGHRSVTGG